MTKNNQKGFTLVELSIVLVIIGLLIGGILAAQSMITTTKVQAFVRQMGQYDAAVANFQDKFAGLPGDSSKINGIGNNDGTIVSGGTDVMTGEAANFWPDLGLSGLKNESGANFTSDWSGGVTTTTAPKSKAGTNAIVLGFGTAGSGNYYVAGAPNAWGAATAFKMKGGFKEADGLAIDVKMDDGDGTLGNVRGYQVAETTFAAVNIATGSAGGAAYTPASATDCLLAIRMGSSYGDLK